MAKHALTAKSQKLVAAFAASGLFATGLAVPIAQVSFADVPCEFNFTDEPENGKRLAIQAALNVCDTISIDGTGDGNSVELSSAEEFVIPNSQNVAREVSISSSTGFTIVRGSGTYTSLLRVDAASASVLPISSLTVEGLTFMNGTNSYVASQNAGLGGAIQVTDADTTLFIINSTFSANEAGYGGAVFSQGDVIVDSSTFYGNQATHPEIGIGGAIWSVKKLYSLNSTYVGNSADPSAVGGGAIYSGKLFGTTDTTSAVFLVHNTFSGNTVPNAQLGGTAVLGRNIRHFGNLFAGPGQPSDFLFSYADPATIEDSATTFVSGSAAILGLEETLDQNDATAGRTQTLALQAGSSAIDAVAIGNAEFHDTITDEMNFAFGRTVMPVTVDQRGFTRLGAADAGAFEFGAQQTDDDQPTSSTPLTPVVIEVNPRSIKVKNEIVTLFGVGLSVFSQVFVDGKPVEVLSVSGDRITFRAPAAQPGTYDITLSGSSQNLVVPKGLTYAKAIKAGARTVVPGFGANSIKLTNPMKKEIRAFLRANSSLNNVVCKGFTSAPATPQDRMLARERGKVTCAFIKKLRPEANVTLRSGSHTDKPGLQIRRVQITLR
jgi:hypothetical protein